MSDEGPPNRVVDRTVDGPLIPLIQDFNDFASGLSGGDATVASSREAGLST